MAKDIWLCPESTLLVGRKQIKKGEEIPSTVAADVVKRLKAKGKIGDAPKQNGGAKKGKGD